MKILLLGKGISNNGVKKVLDKYNIIYDYLNTDEVLNYNYDLIIKSPGIKYSNEVINKFISNNSLVITDIEFIYWLYNKFIISITGSNGKTTTSSIINYILKDSILCGNIGYSISEAVLNSNKNILVLESSSFQLEGTIRFKPNIFIILPISKCHLDHHKTFDDYINSKLKCLYNMTSKDTVIYPLNDMNVLKYINNSSCNKISYDFKDGDICIKDDYIYYFDERIISINDLWDKKEHNILNSMISISCLKLLDIKNETIIEGLKSFKSCKYRLEKLNDFIYNDSKSTNPTSTYYAIKSLDNIFLICGGMFRYDDYNILNDLLYKIKCVFIYGSNKDIIYNYFKEKNIISFKYDSLEDAYKESLNKRDNEIILFSPMSSSKDMYTSFEERGNEFEKLVKKYSNY